MGKIAAQPFIFGWLVVIKRCGAIVLRNHRRESDWFGFDRHKPRSNGLGHSVRDELCPPPNPDDDDGEEQ
jgi:hypothetical protein